MALSQNDINEINQLIADYIGENKTSVSQLPEASTLAGLWILGVSAGASVKASMELLQGLDGKSAEMRKTGSEIQWRVTGGTWAKLIDVDDIRGYKTMLQKTSTEIQWKYENDANWQTLLEIADLKGDQGDNIELNKSATHVQWRVVGAGNWINLIALSDLAGEAGKNIEIGVSGDYIQWRVIGAPDWTNLIATSELKGAKGDAFTYSDFTPSQLEGLKGNTGASIEMNISATHVQWRVVGSSTWINLIALSELKGTKGDDAKEVEFQKTATHLQWRRVGGTWVNLILLDDLKGNKGDYGKEVQLQKTSTHLQWRLEGGSWANLVALADLKGDTGAVPIISVGTVQTVAPGGQSSAEFVTDGVDGNGVQKYKLNLVLVQGATGSVGSIETVTVAFTQAGTRTNINTGDTFATLFGKIKKWFADLGTLAFKSSVLKTDLESSVQTSLGKADTALQSESDPTVPSWAKQTNKPSYAATEVGALPSSHNTDNSAHSDIRSEVAAVRLIAEGALVGYALDTVAAMNSWIAIPANKAKLKIGNSLFIRALDVPDYWWDGAQALMQESEKVDLTGYLLSSVAASTYVAKESGKSLMTDAERTKLTNIQAGATNLSLGETSATAYRGDRGKTAYDHSQSTHAPSNAQKNSDITKEEIEAKLTGAITSHTHNTYMEAAKIQVVASLPSSPDSSTFYFIPE